MQMNLYHVEREADQDALITYGKLMPEVHEAHGALWLSLSHGVGNAFVVVALPVDVRLERFAGVEPAATTDDADLKELDSAYTPAPVTVPVTTVEETA